jgi:hypothetical protein
VLWTSSGMVAYSHLRRADSLMDRTLAQPPGAVSRAADLLLRWGR